MVKKKPVKVVVPRTHLRLWIALWIQFKETEKVLPTFFLFRLYKIRSSICNAWIQNVKLFLKGCSRHEECHENEFCQVSDGRCLPITCNLNLGDSSTRQFIGTGKSHEKVNLGSIVTYKCLHGNVIYQKGEDSAELQPFGCLLTGYSDLPNERAFTFIYFQFFVHIFTASELKCYVIRQAFFCTSEEKLKAKKTQVFPNFRKTQLKKVPKSGFFASFYFISFQKTQEKKCKKLNFPRFSYFDIFRNAYKKKKPE